MRKVLLVLKSVTDALVQKGKGGSTIHHPFDELDFRHLTFDLSTPHGRMMATIIAGIDDFGDRTVSARLGMRGAK